MFTGKIGLNAFLFWCYIPGVMLPVYGCSNARETAFHVVVSYPIYNAQRSATYNTLIPRILRIIKDFTSALYNLLAALIIIY